MKSPSVSQTCQIPNTPHSPHTRLHAPLVRLTRASHVCLVHALEADKCNSYPGSPHSRRSPSLLACPPFHAPGPPRHCSSLSSLRASASPLIPSPPQPPLSAPSYRSWPRAPASASRRASRFARCASTPATGSPTRAGRATRQTALARGAPRCNRVRWGPSPSPGRFPPGLHTPPRQIRTPSPRCKPVGCTTRRPPLALLSPSRPSSRPLAPRRCRSAFLVCCLFIILGADSLIAPFPFFCPHCSHTAPGLHSSTCAVCRWGISFGVGDRGPPFLVCHLHGRRWFGCANHPPSSTGLLASVYALYTPQVHEDHQGTFSDKYFEHGMC
jgi:hypothetical protein